MGPSHTMAGHHEGFYVILQRSLHIHVHCCVLVAIARTWINLDSHRLVSR